MSDRDEFGAFLVGFIVGGLSGAVAALLFAPQSGEETRAVIKERSIELADKASAEAEDAWRRAEAATIEARQKTEEFARQAMSQGEDLVNQAKTQGKEITLKARQVGGDLVESTKETVKKATSRGKKSDEIEAPAE